MIRDFWKAYSEKYYPVFSEDFIKNDKTPAGIDVHALSKDVTALKNKKNK